MPQSDDESGQEILHESWEERERRIEQEFTNRLILFCPDCQGMTRYTVDSLTWHCSECGGGDLSTEKVKELIQDGL